MSQPRTALFQGLLLTAVFPAVCVVALAMVTSPDRWVRSLGMAVQLPCAFRADEFNHFDNPVFWLKQQGAEEVPVNIQGVVNHPFADTGRVTLTFVSEPPKYTFHLTINGVTRSDIGNYTCIIRGGLSRILANVTHILTVLAPAEQVIITDDNNSDPSQSPSRLYLTEHVPSPVRCVALGAYPAPRMRLTVGQYDVTTQLRYSTRRMTTGVPGVRRVSYRGELHSDAFTPRMEYDGAAVTCSARVPGLASRATAIGLTVYYYPKISCRDRTAYLGERNLTLSCVVTARPRATLVRWLTARGASFTDVLTSTAYTSTSRIVNETTLETLLHMSEASALRFTAYTVEAVNRVGTSYSKLTLHKVLPPLPTTPRPLWWHDPAIHHSTPPSISKGGHYVFIISAANRVSPCSATRGSFQTYAATCLLCITCIMSVDHMR